jgi:hypothetical protein
MALPRFYDVDGAITFFQILGITFKKSTFVNWRAKGNGPKHFKINGKTYYKEKDLQEFLADLTEV